MNEVLMWLESRSMILLLGVSSVFTCFWLLHFKEALRLGRLEAVVLSITHVVIGVCAVSLFAFLEAPSEYTLGVQSLFGGVFFMPLAYGAWAKITKRDYKTVFDVFSVCLVFTLLCARTNCMISSCCLGKLIPGLDGFRWPTREFEILFYVVLLIHIVPKVLGNRNCGEIYPLYMMAYGLFRFVNELLRSGNGLFHLSHLWALISFIIGTAILLEIGSKKKARR